MNDPLIVLAAIIALGVLYVMLPVFLDVFLRFRKDRYVTCPHKNDKASLNIDAKWAGLTSLTGKSELRLKNCTLWQGEMSCNKECLSQL
ncbi:hypothetical protein GWO43_02655 [candidate division KSB1 bacterium]|nr:hypothetical protein [candidate division KSB1 bacterium]NIR69771.1 hypothetical protein [candidate division KSB1 bacterium]NIS22954.1 hypothetical protein [candidate division KSB1 bacterium]NIT69811.1 hypothetical protein [candidate division KSB1 bacterium]NIU23485.1 hypothetical protein [candidate division KSB1 bacterium]